jgi:hypothetical protein
VQFLRGARLDRVLIEVPDVSNSRARAGARARPEIATPSTGVTLDARQMAEMCFHKTLEAELIKELPRRYLGAPTRCVLTERAANGFAAQ